MDNVTLSPQELGLVGLVVVAAGVLLWRTMAMHSRDLAAMRDAFVGEASPLRELARQVGDLNANVTALAGQLDAYVVELREARGDVTPPLGTYALTRRGRTPPRGSGGG